MCSDGRRQGGRRGRHPEEISAHARLLCEPLQRPLQVLLPRPARCCFCCRAAGRRGMHSWLQDCTEAGNATLPYQLWVTCGGGAGCDGVYRDTTFNALRSGRAIEGGPVWAPMMRQNCTSCSTMYFRKVRSSVLPMPNSTQPMYQHAGRMRCLKRPGWVGGWTHLQGQHLHCSWVVVRSGQRSGRRRCGGSHGME